MALYKLYYLLTYLLLESERLNVRKKYNLCDSAVFYALHDQLASLGRHAQLTRCFSAVAELLVLIKLRHHCEHIACVFNSCLQELNVRLNLIVLCLVVFSPACQRCFVLYRQTS